MSTVILGGGIMGLSTAYHLTRFQPGTTVHILDPAPVLHLAASAYAGGFLAEDWFSAAAAPLGALSFRLHRELAAEHDGARRWGYAASTPYSLGIEGRRVTEKKSLSGGRRRTNSWYARGTSRAGAAPAAEDGDALNEDGSPAWVTRQPGGTLEVIGTEGSCAQVEPRDLCEWLAQEVQSQGVTIHLNTKVTGTATDETTGRLRGVTTEDTTNGGEKTTIECKNILITSGAWSPRVFSTLFPQSRTKIGIRPLAGYSVVVRSPRHTLPLVDPSDHISNNRTCHAVFCGPGPNWTFAPEAFTRIPENRRPEIYIAGLNDAGMPLPTTVADVKALTDKTKLDTLRRATVQLAGLSGEGDDLLDDDLEVVREGLCFRPVSDSGRPVVTKFTRKQLGAGVEMLEDGGGVFMAAGHGPWGISMSLGTGLVMAELILGRETSADISQLGV